MANVATEYGSTVDNKLRILGSPDRSMFDSYCGNHGGDYRESTTAYGASCGGQGISMTDLCRTGYHSENAYERIKDFYKHSDAGAWECFTGGRQLGGVDLGKLCSANGYPKAELRGNTANDWWCTGGGSRSDFRIEHTRFDEACRLTYTWDAISRIAWEWPNGTSCWGNN
jgi:hypothetical protein